LLFDFAWTKPLHAWRLPLDAVIGAKAKLEIECFVVCGWFFDRSGSSLVSREMKTVDAPQGLAFF